MSIRRSWSVFLSHLTVIYPDVKCQRTEFRMWNVPRRQANRSNSIRIPHPGVRYLRRQSIRINSIRIPQEDMWRSPLSGLPQGEAHDTHDHHTRTIAYPIRICCPDHWLNVGKPSYLIPKICNIPCSAALLWCVRTPCPDIFVLDSKELSSISDLLWW